MSCELLLDVALGGTDSIFRERERERTLNKKKFKAALPHQTKEVSEGNIQCTE